MDSTTLKALKILETLVRGGRPRGISDLSREIGLPKSNIHRALTTLEAAEYVRRTSESTYTPTLKLWELGLEVMAQVDIRAIAAPHLKALVAETGESVILAVLDGHDVVYVDKAESGHAIQAITHVGSRIPAYSVGTGKAMLAFASEALQAEVAARAVAHTSSTIVGEDALRNEFAAIRARGYAINRGEFRDEVSGVAAPILDGSGAVIGGVGVWGPDQRFSSKLDVLGVSVLACARRISAEFGAKAASLPISRKSK
ncbi:IclR family transcriptional regulator [Xanthobacter dioxanivorans]|uniref:IclR family transcriptional regulator n=1 Tax=Xanthobacter dioxanivorans TaxID=2528964 RepID=A0A974PMG1_9HYPH|nr:IclR family transcriptional regulator [Xanthobacter dioxanivorans]QRG06285.1 IclR family transcriptional regulator [Xanthobacter dioxanivorans]